MPRQSPSTKSVPYKPSPVPPAKVAPPLPAPYPQMSIGQSIKDGIGLGIGSSLGHRIVGAFFPTNSTVMPSPPPEKLEPCVHERRIFENCLLNESEVFCYQQQTNLSACLKSHANSTETK